MTVTKSGQNNLTSPDGNGLALFVDITDSILKVKDINGNTETVNSYVNRDVNVGVLSMIPPTSPLPEGEVNYVGDQNGTYSGLLLGTTLLSGIGYGGNIAQNNTAFGVSALSNAGLIFTEMGNTAFGYEAMLTVGIGTNNASTFNTAVGYKALYGFNQLGYTQQYNVAIGARALEYARNDSNHVAIGYQALNSPNSSQNNVAIGYRAAVALNGNDNVVIGKEALKLSNASSNVVIGNQALTNATGATDSVVVGANAAANMTSLGNSVVVGTEAMYNAGTGRSEMVAVGYQALYNGGINGDIAIGYQALYSKTTGGGGTISPEIAIGYHALYSNNIGGNNIAIGLLAMENSTIGANNIAIGSYALKEFNGGDTIAIGEYCAYQLTSGLNNIFFGQNVGTSLATCEGSIGIGNYALSGLEAASSQGNIAIGYAALQGIQDVQDCIAIGVNSLLNNLTSWYNTAIGFESLNSLESGIGYNVALGYQSALNLTTGVQNVYAGASVTSSIDSSNNVVVGHAAVGTGSDNTIVGQGASSGGFSGSVVLGRSAVATASNQFVVGSTGTPVGTVATETVTSDRSWSVRINGTAYKILLKA